VHAESLGLFRGYATKGPAKAFGQLAIFGGLRRCRRVVRDGIPVGRARSSSLPVSPTKAIHGPNGRQPPK
jgi:hypothetical protein